MADAAPANVFQIPNPLSLGAAATSPEAHTFVLNLLSRLTLSEELAGQRALDELRRSQFGDFWRHADLTTVLWAAATLIRPRTYLEIGVRRGRSAAVVASVCPACEIYGFDLWIEGYAGVENPGADFVRAELEAVEHSGALTLTSGDSRETVPRFLDEHPDLYFDLISLDGDHSTEGAAADLTNVLPRLEVGGIVVVDDICIFPTLREVWDELVGRDGRFLTCELDDAGFGLAAAVRASERPLGQTFPGDRGL